MNPTRPTGSTHAGPPTGRSARSPIFARRADWQVVWFKRDLRISDHAPLMEALRLGPVIGLYLYEPELLESPEWDASHSRFVPKRSASWNRSGPGVEGVCCCGVARPWSNSNACIARRVLYACGRMRKPATG